MLKKVEHEILHLLPVVAFFFVAFNIVALVHGLMQDGYTKWWTGFGIATGMAVVVGKAVLIADALPFMKEFRQNALVYVTAWKASVYVTAAIVVLVAEKLIEHSMHYHGLVPGYEHMITEVDWRRFWAVQIILAIFLAVYAAYSELSRALEPGQLHKMFFKR